MTNEALKEEKRRRVKSFENYAYLFLSALLLCISVLFSKEASIGAKDGLLLAATSIIPSIFPFFIFADFLQFSVSRTKSGKIGKIFEKLFGISSDALGAFICGIICGFPIGVKYASSLYNCGILEKKECEHLIGFVNNPSLAFVISGIGVGMRASLKDGILLYLSVVISAMITGIIYKSKQQKINNHPVITEQNFNVVVSIKNAGYNSLTVTSYIVFFSTVIGIIKGITKNKIILSFISVFLEIGNAAKIISSINSPMAFSILGFALGFSSISVHLQARAVLPPDISLKKYYKMKITQGIICAFIAGLTQAI